MAKDLHFIARGEPYILRPAWADDRRPRGYEAVDPPRAAQILRALPASLVAKFGPASARARRLYRRIQLRVHHDPQTHEDAPYEDAPLEMAPDAGPTVFAPTANPARQAAQAQALQRAAADGLPFCEICQCD